MRAVLGKNVNTIRIGLFRFVLSHTVFASCNLVAIKSQYSPIIYQEYGKASRKKLPKSCFLSIITGFLLRIGYTTAIQAKNGDICLLRAIFVGLLDFC